MLNEMQCHRFQFAHFHSAYFSQLTCLQEFLFKTVQQEKLVAPAITVIFQNVLKIAGEKNTSW